MWQNIFQDLLKLLEENTRILQQKKTLFIWIFRILAKFCTKNFIFSYGLHHNQPIM